MGPGLMAVEGGTGVWVSSFFMGVRSINEVKVDKVVARWARSS